MTQPGVQQTPLTNTFPSQSCFVQVW